MQIGKFQTLQISRFTQNGAYLKDELNQEVLLPNKFILPTHKLNDFIEVFIYTDSLDRIVATTQKPYGILDEITLLEIVSIVDNGCYLNIGLDKDIFMPSKAPERFNISQKVMVKITTDKQNRLIAKLGIKEHLKSYIGQNKYMKVNIFPFEKTPLGIGCIVEKRYYGLVFHNEIFSPIELNIPIEGYIKNVRKDGKIDLSLKPIGENTQEKNHLFEIIKNQKILELDFNSPPEQIYQVCHMSKKKFKMLINILIKEKKIYISDSLKHSNQKCFMVKNPKTEK